MLNKARLYLHTLPHLKGWQIAGRIIARLRSRFNLTAVPAPPSSLRGSRKASVSFPQHEPWNEGQQLLQGQFCFLNRAADLGWPPNWEPDHLPLLWQFNLHYFNYLHLLEPNDQKELCRDWIEKNPVGSGVGWHAYPTSLRIANWCKGNLQDTDVQKSLYRQAAYLYRNLETYVYGNHLLENARALVLAGRFFDGHGEAAQWLEKGVELYLQETAEQILPDGGHYERSPMYHALMLEGYLDTLNVMASRHPARPAISEAAKRMTDVLSSLTHPDGRLALFNDATREIPPRPETLVSYAQALLDYETELQSHLPETGYFVHRDKAVYLIIDGGAVGPDHLLAHAHADIFSYELSLHDRPFVVDSGVYEYRAGVMRDYVRSTKAHSTVCVDGRDQVECWDSFRVARRSAPHVAHFETTDNASCFTGVFDGYAQLLGDEIVHHRCITTDNAKREIEVRDEVRGNGIHHVESRIRIHPEVKVTGRGPFLLRRRDATCHLQVHDGTLRWEKGWYCPEFGRKQENWTAVVEKHGSLPVSLTYTIRY